MERRELKVEDGEEVEKGVGKGEYRRRRIGRRLKRERGKERILKDDGEEAEKGEGKGEN